MSGTNMKRPIILKRMIVKPQANGSIKLPIKNSVRSSNINNKLIKLATIPLYREDVVFRSNGESFLPGEYQSVTIINKLNNLTNNCQTIAKCVTRENEVIERTSDNVTHIIGQEAYNTIFYALCSVINPEFKIKAILSLLTVSKIVQKLSFKIEHDPMGHDKSCQTDETRINKIKKERRRIRKVLVPYVVKPEEAKLKKLTIDPFQSCLIKAESLKCNESNSGNDADYPDISFKKEIEVADEKLEKPTSSTESELPDLGHLHDDSNDSVKSFSTLHSFKTISDLLLNPISLVNNVEKHTKDQLILPNYTVHLMDKSVIKIPFKPEDDFHIATKDNLQYLDELSRKKLLLHQMQMDYKHCLTFRDEDGNLPIHLAVINDDLELLKRQCVVLKIRNQSVDILAGNGLTALKLSIFRESALATNVLLHHGADPFLVDEEHSACVHLAAELRTDHLSIILHHCKLNARSIIAHHAEELQTPGWQDKTDEELGTIVLHHICSLFDKQGHTPLMLASKLGLYENVRLVLESAPRCVAQVTPTAGNTALFLAVSAACILSAERGNRSKVVDHFRKTIELLLDSGADPAVNNHSGSNVNILLQDFHCKELSLLIANKVTYKNYFYGEEDHTKNCDSYVLMKEGGKISIQELNKRKILENVAARIVADLTKNDDLGQNVAKVNNDIVIVTKKKLVAKKKLAKSLDQDVTTDKNVANVTKKDQLATNVTKKSTKGDKLVTTVKNSKANKIVIKQTQNQSASEADKKPIITENILLKSSGSTLDSKDIVKMEVVPTVAKIIWTESKKRKVEDKCDSAKKNKEF